jgi:hypothetical protein
MPQKASAIIFHREVTFDVLEISVVIGIAVIFCMLTFVPSFACCNHSSLYQTKMMEEDRSLCLSNFKI